MNIRNNARIIILPLIIILLCFQIGCGKRHEEMTKISYRLKWLFNASVAGDIYAGAHGFFAKEGLEVEVKEGGPEGCHKRA